MKLFIFSDGIWSYRGSHQVTLGHEALSYDVTLWLLTHITEHEQGHVLSCVNIWDVYSEQICCHQLQQHVAQLVYFIFSVYVQ